MSLPAAESGGLYALLEQFNAQLNCSATDRPWLVGISHHTRRAVLVRPDCGRWSCPQCGRKNKLRWTHRIARGVDIYQKLGERWYFGTLTARADRRGFDTSLEDWRRAWPKLLLRIKRLRHGHVFRFVMVPEVHKDDTVHMHVLWNYGFAAHLRRRKDGSYYWRSKWLADNCAETGLGYIHDCRPCASELQAAFYISKYIGKGLDLGDWPLGTRRIRTSHHWPELPQSDDSGAYAWDVVRPSSMDLITLANLVPMGYHLQIGKSTIQF